ncbi:MAG: NapC/NirT family cytochrome c [Phycisphaerae bacterium]|nr:NapC/NirT family cytochrome c [Phycisphaerae bacterium]
MFKIKKVIPPALKKLWKMRWHSKILLLILMAGVFTGGSLVVTSQPGFCNSCHIMNSYYASWQKSSHSEINCLDCHLQPGFTGYIKGKINGLAQAVDCAVGRIGTKPNAKILDASCLRSECHSNEEITAKVIDFHGIKFKHEKHVSKLVDGIPISCGTCHSHFEGDEHFTVNTGVCYTCHFLKGSDNAIRMVDTRCQSCHEVPNKIIERGMVKINHAEFVSYNASCDDSCHKKQIEKVSNVSDTVCLNCHSFGKEGNYDGKKLHEEHAGGEKVECFACHDKVSHTQSKFDSVSGMMDCKSCHRDTHNVQLDIYTAQWHSEEQNSERVLSPMFLTHVECTACHIQPGQVKSAGIGSIGTVAKAIPQACDRCHEAGTGEKYIPFWQDQIKKFYEQVRNRLQRLEEQQGQSETPEKSKELKNKIQQAKKLLASVESDGSWGVHNLKYTETMLREANRIITEAQQD